jgi:TP901 family phage tail tape measure protein
MALTAMRVPTVFTAVDRFSSVVSKMTRSTTAFGKSAEAAAMRSSRRFSDAGTSMLSAGAGMAVGIGLAVNEAVKFEKAMANVSTTIDSTPELMKQMSDSVLQMSTKIPVPISQLTDALYDVVSAGIAAKDSMFVLEQSSLLGVSGLGTAKEGVDIITSALNSFNMKATESANVANMVFKAVKYGKTTVSGLAESFGSSSALVKNANVSLEEYLATTATLTTTGMTASRAQTQISSAVTALIKPSKTMGLIFNKLGVKDVPKWIKANGSLVKSLQIVRDKGEEMGVLSSKAFGRKEGFSAMLSLLGPLAEKYKLVMGDIVSGTDSMTEAVAKQQKTFSAQFQIMKNKVTKLAITIGNELMPRIINFMDTVSPMITGLTSWAGRNQWLATTILNVTVGLLALGALAKVGAVLFFGLSKAIAITSAITRTFTFISTLAALSNVSLASATLSTTGAMWEFVAAELAVLAPIALVVGALGVLAIAYKMVSDATRKTMYTNVDSYKKSDASIKYSTVVMQSEFDKQFNLMVAQKNRVDAFNGKSVNVGGIGVKKGGFYNLDNPFVNAKSSANPFLDEQRKSKSSFLSPSERFKNYGAIGSNFSQPDVSQPKNLAGKSETQYRLPKIGGELKIVVESKDGSKVNVDSSKVYGISAKTDSTTGVKN